MVSEVINLSLRAQFGIAIQDKDLSDEIRIGIEAFQKAKNKHDNKK